MKIIFCAALYCLLSLFLYGQGFAISGDKMNIAYLGVDNPLTIVAGQCDCNELVVATNNGSLKKTVDCSYTFLPDQLGVATITVKGRIKGKMLEIGSGTMRIKPIPAPEALCGNVREGALPVAVMRAQMGVITRLEGFDWPVRFVVVSYHFMISRNGVAVYQADNTGAAFQQETSGQMGKVMPGDRITISDIKATGPDKITRRLNDVEISVKQ